MRNVTGLLLAAGLSTRMGISNKLIRTWRGKALVRHVVDAALGSGLHSVVVVTGHEAEAVTSVLPKHCLAVQNRDFAQGLAGSIRCGLSHMPAPGPVMILLGDMPLVTAEHIDALLAAFEELEDDGIVVATCEGAWGNPVVFGSHYFQKLELLAGDHGARRVVEAHRERVKTVEIGSAARRDFDTPAAFTQEIAP